MRALFVSKDQGNARAGADVARAFVQRGWEAVYVLDKRGAAWRAYGAGSDLEEMLQGTQVVGAESPAEWLDHYNRANVVLVTLSASGAPNLELNAVGESRLLGRQKPVYGLEEVIGGRNNPGWEKGNYERVRALRRLFTALPTNEDHLFPNVTVTGPPQLSRYRGVDLDELGRKARLKLEIPLDQPIVYFSGQPEPENPHVLSRLGEALASIRHLIPAGTVLVVSRHGRELDRGRDRSGNEYVTGRHPDNAAAHRHALRHIRDRVRIRAVENSLDHKDLPDGHEEAIPQEFQPAQFATYQELVCACKDSGAVVTGFGADGMIVAPHLGVPSILYLDLRGYLFGGLLYREKKMNRLPLPVVPQVPQVPDLAGWLEMFLSAQAYQGALRAEHVEALKKTFAFPEQDPAEKIVDIVLKDLA